MTNDTANVNSSHPDHTQLAGPELDVRLLINELRWHLHDLWPELVIPGHAITGQRRQQRLQRRLAGAEQSARVRIAHDELRRVRDLSRTIDDIEAELGELVTQLAPRLLAEPGCGVLIAAKLLGEIAGIGRFATDAKLAQTAGTAPIPASPGRTQRHRLDRGGNRQLNPRPRPTSNARPAKARPAEKRCDASNDSSPDASFSSSSPLTTQARTSTAATQTMRTPVPRFPQSGSSS